MNEVERDSSDWVERGETMRERMVKSLSEMKKWKFENGVKVNEKLMVCYVENMLEKGGNRKRSVSEMYWVYMKG